LISETGVNPDIYRDGMAPPDITEDEYREKTMNRATNLAIEWIEQGHMLDVVMRAGIRRLLVRRLDELAARDAARAGALVENFVEQMDGSPIAPLPHKANEQHYEVPAEFFALALGPHRKYSSCYWPEGAENLEQAEAAALRDTAAHAGLDDGQHVLELGCGWGSLTLWMAAHYPASRITAVSNSASQRRWIEAEAGRRGLTNVRVITSDMNEFDTDETYDRIVSVEMFEHMRNWRALFARVHRWLVPGGRFFMHVFCHRSTPYAFEDSGPSDWMSRYFFSGGMMPSDELALRFQDDLRLKQRWRWDGRHYEKTANAWLANLDRNKGAVMPILERTYGIQQAGVWFVRWRMFFMACAELFGYDQGQQWWVSHYLFERPVKMNSR
jgi:cyclopropane-fatty-acyl-phospholipid synthase